MLYLILAILSSAAISILMRLGETHIKNNMAMFITNYAVCGLLSYAFMLVDGNSLVVEEAEDGLGFAIGLGLLVGVFFLLGFMLLQLNIAKNGVVLASTFMRMGVMVPVLMAIIVFGEKPGVLQLVGFVLAIVAILVINGDKSEESSPGKKKAGLLLIILLITGGLSDSASNIYDKLGSETYKNHYLLFIFVAAIVLSTVVLLIKKQHFTLMDAGWGLAIGIPNYFSARFLLLSLSGVKAIVVYPVYNAMTILLISLIGLLFFKEKLGRRKLIGLLLIVGAIVLLNM